MTRIVASLQISTLIGNHPTNIPWSAKFDSCRRIRIEASNVRSKTRTVGKAVAQRISSHVNIGNFNTWIFLLDPVQVGSRFIEWKDAEQVLRPDSSAHHR